MPAKYQIEIVNAVDQAVAQKPGHEKLTSISQATKDNLRRILSPAEHQLNDESGTLTRDFAAGTISAIVFSSSSVRLIEGLLVKNIPGLIKANSN